VVDRVGDPPAAQVEGRLARVPEDEILVVEILVVVLGRVGVDLGNCERRVRDWGGVGGGVARPVTTRPEAAALAPGGAFGGVELLGVPEVAVVDPRVPARDEPVVDVPALVDHVSEQPVVPVPAVAPPVDGESHLCASEAPRQGVASVVSGRAETLPPGRRIRDALELSGVVVAAHLGRVDPEKPDRVGRPVRVPNVERVPVHHVDDGGPDARRGVGNERSRLDCGGDAVTGGGSLPVRRGHGDATPRQGDEYGQCHCGRAPRHSATNESARVRPSASRGTGSAPGRRLPGISNT